MTKEYTLKPNILVSAYSQGFFPMPEPKSGEIRWYRPDPRAVIPLDGFHISHSLQKKLKKSEFRISFNQAFAEVMQGCSEREETWINDEFRTAYGELHSLGLAHSVEVWRDEQLVGGLYGLGLGAAFFAESMFHKVTDASKIALHHLVERLKAQGFVLLECQFLTPHLQSLGAIEISDREYMIQLRNALKLKKEF